MIQITPYKRYVRGSLTFNRYIDERTMVNQPQETTQESQPENDFQWNNIWGK